MATFFNRLFDPPKSPPKKFHEMWIAKILVARGVQSCELKKKSVFRDPFRCPHRHIGWVCRTTWLAFLIKSSGSAGFLCWIFRRPFFGDVFRSHCGKTRMENSRKNSAKKTKIVFRFFFCLSLCFSLFSSHPILRATFYLQTPKFRVSVISAWGCLLNQPCEALDPKSFSRRNFTLAKKAHSFAVRNVQSVDYFRWSYDPSSGHRCYTRHLSRYTCIAMPYQLFGFLQLHKLHCNYCAIPPMQTPYRPLTCCAACKTKNKGGYSQRRKSCPLKGNRAIRGISVATRIGTHVSDLLIQVCPETTTRNNARLSTQ